MKKFKIIFGAIIIFIFIAIVCFRTESAPLDRMSNLPKGDYF